MTVTQEFSAVITLLQTIADTGKTGTSSLSIIEHSVQEGYVEDNLSKFKPWKLTSTGCEVLGNYLITKADVVELIS